jgi:ADP-heptose:LPS heptosyltransferase
LPLDPEHTDSLLLLRLDGIGDNVCSWPALELLRRNLPQTRIILAVGPWVAPLYRECPWIDEIVAWDSGLFGLFRGKGMYGVMADLKRSGELRRRGFTAGIDLRGDLLSILLLRMVAPGIRIATVTRGGTRLLTDPLVIHEGHEAQRAFDVARASLGLPSAPAPRPGDWLRPAAHERARHRLQAAGWDDAKTTVALCPLALWPWKQWPEERFRELALRLQRELALQVVWFLEHRDQAVEYAGDDPIFCGPLDEVAAALSFCRLAVSNDSGLMHLAVAAGCRTVQLFGPGDSARFAHQGEGLTLHHDTSCEFHPCTRSGSCGNLTQGWCLDNIRVDEVFASCIRLMSEAA